ncbi:unnamed protein product, partial [Ectocarpus sp. 12 AP-2014]
GKRRTADPHGVDSPQVEPPDLSPRRHRPEAPPYLQLLGTARQQVPPPQFRVRTPERSLR